MMNKNFINPMWDRFYESLQDINLEKFYNHPTIKQTVTAVSDVYKKEMQKHLMFVVFVAPLLNFKDWEFVNNSLWRYVYYFYLLHKHFGQLDDYNILEIGPGYGGLCKISLSVCPEIKKYTVVDHPNMLRIFDYFLGNKDRIERFEIDETIYAKQKYDLFISTLCLSETALDFINFLGKDVLPYCSRIFIISSAELRNDLEYYLDKYFKFTKTKYINYLKTYVYIGEKM